MTDRRNAAPDLIAAGIGVILIAVAFVVGIPIEADKMAQVDSPPLAGSWEPHLGIGTPLAVVIAGLVIGFGPRLAQRLGWRQLLWLSWPVSMAWIYSLALIDGWHKGIYKQLTSKNEYVPAVDRFDDIPETLRGFNDHILMYTPDNWGAHIAGHPPAATLTFVLLDHIGLGGGHWAGIFVVTLAASVAAAVALTVKTLASQQLARRALPFLVLAPAAVWLGVSGDAYFAAVTSWMTALLAIAAVHTRYWAGLAAGLLFGLTWYLSYGLTLFTAMVITVLALARTLKPLPLFLLGTLVVPVWLTALGFNWWEAYHLLVERYYQGAGGERPYWYWAWANLAVATVVIGLAGLAGAARDVAGLPGAVKSWFGRGDSAHQRFVLLLGAVIAMILVADLSGMSKSETERIWLPFNMFLLAATALLPARHARWWLAAQAGLALAVNHLLYTSW